jgi:hypothetical protein
MSGKDILQKALVCRHVFDVPWLSTRHTDDVCAPVEYLRSKRSIQSAPDRHLQNIWKCGFSYYHTYYTERTVLRSELSFENTDSWKKTQHFNKSLHHFCIGLNSLTKTVYFSIFSLFWQNYLHMAQKSQFGGQKSKTSDFVVFSPNASLCLVCGLNNVNICTTKYGMGINNLMMH